MAPQIIHLPDGHHFIVTPVFAGLFFKSHELSTHANAYPIGWSVVLHTEEEDGVDSDDDEREGEGEDKGRDEAGTGKASGGHKDRDAENRAVAPTAKKGSEPRERRTRIRSYTRPTLQHDKLFISSISTPSGDARPAASPTRQIAMMLWITLYWYFHQPEPDAILRTGASKATPDAGKPRGEWRIGIKRDGVLRGRNLIPKLERMGLLTTLDSAVGTATDDSSDCWSRMFVSRSMFWQIPGRLFLFTQPTEKRLVQSFPGSPASSRPGSPAPPGSLEPPYSPSPAGQVGADVPGAPTPLAATIMPSAPLGPFYSSSHLPTYYPPPPPVYTMTDHIRHPVRPKPPRMGEIFYTRFVPSAGQYLSFRAASLSDRPVPYMGALGPNPPPSSQLLTLSDTSLLQLWLGKPRVSAFWGDYVPDFLTKALTCRHSFPVIGMWDGVPFGYFEIYWVKEDDLGRYVGGGAADDYDRGIHVFIGEDWARGRVQSWLSSLVHHVFLADNRTNSVCIEPRVDNKRFIQHLQFAGFSKEREIAFPHKQAWFGRLRRDVWEGPAL